MKDDQVRIILKHIKEDVYNVYGVFVKKDDNDMNLYRKMMNRQAPSISSNEDLQIQLELSQNTEKEFNDLITTKARKNSR